MRRSLTSAAALAAGLSIALMVSGAKAQDKAEDNKADVAAGHSFALKVCWACHIVAKDQTEQPILSQPAPSFLDIAQRPNLTSDGLHKFLSTHDETMGNAGKMPNPRLVDYQIDEVVAYILSLRTK
jgi:mono/diheme cytochrome c family protein